MPNDNPSKPLIIPFEIMGAVYHYKMRCPTCGRDQFVMPFDMLQIICASCQCVMLTKIQDDSVLGKVEWIV